jgi:hypothetical protein
LNDPDGREVQIQAEILNAHVHVNVGVDKSGGQTAALEVNDSGFRPDQLGHRLVRPDVQNPAARDGQRLFHPILGIERQHLAVSKNVIGSAGHVAFP